MKRITMLLILLMLVFVFAITAYAAPPERETFEYDVVYPFADCGVEGVGDFWLFNHEVGGGHFKRFYDNDGNFIKEIGHQSGTDNIFAEGYPDKVVTGQFAFNWMVQFDPETGEYTFSDQVGTWWHIMLPGYGNIVHFAGMEGFQYDPDADEWSLIKDNGLRYVDMAPLCEYLAPSP
ncbi:MAG: hypothetical protein KC413_00445 [Anaerolineales bacterium]|nr:hypothetical protein [Anaerolineales bacterium]